MYCWERLSLREKEELIISILEESGRELLTGEIVEAIKERGIEPPSKNQLAPWLRQHMLYKHLERRRKPHPVYGTTNLMLAWKLKS